MISYKIKLYKGKKHKDGTHPIVIELTNNGNTHRLSTGYKTTDKFSTIKRLI